MSLRMQKISSNGTLIAVGLRLVKTPHTGYIVEFEGSNALMELRNKKVVLLSAYGRWDVNTLKTITDYIQKLHYK